MYRPNALVLSHVVFACNRILLRSAFGTANRFEEGAKQFRNDV